MKPPDQTIYREDAATLDEVTQKAFNLPAAEWSGELSVYHPGKVGETFFLHGYLAQLRRVVPKARLVLWTLPTYAFFLKHFRDQFDRIRLLAPFGATLHEQVHTSDVSLFFQGWRVYGNNLRVYSFGLQDIGVPHYAHFGAALGLVEPIVRPVWTGPVISSVPTAALALPTSNIDSSARKKIAFTGAEWEKLGAVLKSKGVEPVATGHPEDPPLDEMPGWLKIPCGLVEAVSVVLSAKFCVGFDSGMVWTHGLMMQGCTTIMLDEHHHIGSESFEKYRKDDHPFDKDRFQIYRIEPDGSKDRDAFGFTLAMAEAL